MAGGDPRSTLAKNRRGALELAARIGTERARKELGDAERDLARRLAAMGKGDQTFTAVQMRSALVQVRQSIADLQPGLRRAIVDTGMQAADGGAMGVAEYLRAADAEYRGVGVQPLAIDEASMFSRARRGAEASILRRLSSEPGAEGEPARVGILDRYGMNVVGHFEDELRVGLLARRPWDEVRGSLVAKSPFLQQAPASWAERIVRTECMGAYNSAAIEANRDADEQLGDVVKILSATFDERTGSDSIAVHGQIRRTNEAFDTWFGQVMQPPDRPNDRGIVVTHRLSWPIPRELYPRARSEVAARWAKEKRKGPMPPIPPDTTVPRGQFGRPQAPRRKARREDE